MYGTLVADVKGPLFRLLTLLPSPDRDGLIRCELDVSPLDTDVPYEALSYCWGEASNDATAIECNDRVFMVRKDLAAALIQLQQPAKPRVLWVDAVCINQDDPDERSQQVALMRQIYAQASGVVVWLGPGDDTISLAFSLCVRAADNWQRLMDDACDPKLRAKALDSIESDWGKASLARSAKSLARTATWLDPSRQDEKEIKRRFHRSKADSPPLVVPSNEKTEMAFVDIMTRSWWSRAWIVQEISLARTATVLCGTCWIEWDALSMAILMANYGLIEDMDSYALNENGAVSLIRYMNSRAEWDESEQEQAAAAKSSPFDLLKILNEFRATYSTDPRDKVYAFLGLLAPGAPSLPADYTASVAACYINTTLACLAYRDNLDCLSTPRFPASGVATALPSWAADWSFFDAKLREMPLGMGFAGRPDEDYCASGLGSRYTATLRFDNGDNKKSPLLDLNGYVLDTVTMLAATLPSGVQQGLPYDGSNLVTTGKLKPVKVITVQYAEYSQVLTQWDTLAESRYPDADERRHVLADILFGGHDTDDQDAYDTLSFELWARDKLAFLERRSLTRWSMWIYHGLMGVAEFADRSKGPRLVAGNRRLVRAGRHLALVPHTTQVGDQVALCTGGKLPLVLRPSGEGEGVWELVGVAYVYGIMHGEAWDGARCRPMAIR